jgi:hypothetical protein
MKEISLITRDKSKSPQPPFNNLHNDNKSTDLLVLSKSDHNLRSYRHFLSPSRNFELFTNDSSKILNSSEKPPLVIVSDEENNKSETENNNNQKISLDEQKSKAENEDEAPKYKETNNLNHQEINDKQDILITVRILPAK